MRTLVIANWKMNPASLKEAKKLLTETKKAAVSARGVSVVVAPPAIFLSALTSGRKGRVSFAAQHAHFEAGGAHTGEISMGQARDAKASYVIIGHAERREMGETDDGVRKKVAAALAAGLTPILCVGEKNREGDGEHLAFVREQLRVALADVAEKDLTKIVIVYEPLWTIGKTTTMKPREMHEMSIFIRKTLMEKFGDAARKATILYGGSVDASNAAIMLREGDVKGFLVGRASWDAKTFGALLKACANA
jgi:triosephosphate isomerase